MQHVNKAITIPEVFDRVIDCPSLDEKAAMLRRYDTKHLRWFINAVFNEDFSMIPAPKQYTPNHRPPEICEMSILTAISRIEAARKVASFRPEQAARNILLVLESVSAREAELVWVLLKGHNRVPGVSKKVFKRAYPEFFRLEEAGAPEEKRPEQG